MIDQQWAHAFAKDWIASWNAHDMDRILSHYTDDFEMTSPLIVERLGLPEGKLKGKRAIREYWLPSLAMQPPLRFELLDVFVGVDVVTIYYHNVGRRLVTETLFFNSSGKATRGMALWSVAKSRGV
jgi:ketosteroid isomerase-like protein